MIARRYPLSGFPADLLNRLAADRFFASPGFADLWRAQGGVPVVWTVSIDGATAAAMPGVEFGRGLFARFQSMPDGCYGGLLVDPLLERERTRLAATLFDALARRRYVKTHIFDFYRTLPSDPRFTTVECETALLNIAEPGWVPPDKKLLAQIQKAEREGIAVEPFDWDRHGKGFLQLVAKTEGRHGRSPRYTAAFYAALAALGREDARVHWVWCQHAGQPACSHIYFVEGGILQGWQIYFDKTFSFIKPNQYIRFVTCRLMAERGVTQLNLGGTPEDAPGLAYYKARWGGRPVRFPDLVRRCGLGRIG